MSDYEKGYLSINNKAVIDLKAYLLRTYSYLISKDYNKKGVYYSQAKMADELGICVRTLQRHIKELKELGFLLVKRRGFNKTNLYTILKNNIGKVKEKVEKQAENFKSKFNYSNKKPVYFVEHCPSRDRSEESGYMTFNEIESKLLGWDT